METESWALALKLTGAEESDLLLASFCTAASITLTGRLREGIAAADCGEVWSSAVALLAAADWQESSRSLQEAVSFRAGEVSVTAPTTAENRQAAAELRELAMRLIAPYSADGGFCFQGV